MVHISVCAPFKCVTFFFSFLNPHGRLSPENIFYSLYCAPSAALPYPLATIFAFNASRCPDYELDASCSAAIALYVSNVSWTRPTCHCRGGYTSAIAFQ